MDIKLRNTSEKCIEVISALPMVKSCEIYGSIARGTEDELSDIDIKVDVSGYDNGKFMLEVPQLLKNELGIIYSDFAPSLAPEQYIVSNAISAENPFTIVDINCVAEPHHTTVSKQQMANDVYTHTLKVWIANMKHFARGIECYNDIVRMANRLRIEDVDSKIEEELLSDTLSWLEENVTDHLADYVDACREKFEELV